MRHLRILGLLACSAVWIACAPEPGSDTELEATGRSEEITVAPQVSWDIRVSGAGSALVLTSPVGQRVVRLSCVRDPDMMTLEVEILEAVGSEERLSFGVDDEVYLFVVDPMADRRVGVYAEAPIHEELLDRLFTGETIGLAYGAQTLGPYRIPDAARARVFADACRAIAED